MLKYVTKRILLIIPTLFGITVVSFLLLNLAPGGPIEQKLQAIRFGQSKGALGGVASGAHVVSEDTLQALKKQYGFDKPLGERYWLWLKNVVRLDFGDSAVFGRPALEVITERAPVSLAFGLASFAITYALALSLGLFMAVHKGSSVDDGLSLGLIAIAALPAFIVGVLMLVFLAGDTFVSWFPVGYLQSDNYADLAPLAKIWDRAHHALLPLVCYVLGSFTALALLGRNTIAEENSKDYSRTARAKGLRERTVFGKHVFRNSLIPLVTGMGGTLAAFLSGSVLVESVFQLNGIGLLGMQSVMSRDYNLIMALLVLSSGLLLVGNLVSDILYMIVDPRVRLS